MQDGANVDGQKLSDVPDKHDKGNANDHGHADGHDDGGLVAQMVTKMMRIKLPAKLPVASLSSCRWRW